VNLLDAGFEWTSAQINNLLDRVGFVYEGGLILELKARALYNIDLRMASNFSIFCLR
jgi:hypothetical protein